MQLFSTYSVEVSLFIIVFTREVSVMGSVHQTIYSYARGIFVFVYGSQAAT